MTLSLTRGLTAVTAAALIAGGAYAGGEHWTDNFAQAQQTAEAEGKDLLLDFTGSDWCPPCIALTEEVFSTDSFLAAVEDHFVLVELDYPNEKPQSDELKAQNEELAERYSITGFPTILLADANGMPYAEMGGYEPGSGPEAYIEQLEALMPVRAMRDEKFAAADNARGIEKAQLLHEGLQAMGDDLVMVHYQGVINELKQLDADNEAGIKGYYERLELVEEQKATIQNLMGEHRGDPNAAIAALDEMLADDALTTEARQYALAMKSQSLLFGLEDEEAAKPVLEAAIAIDPDSEFGQMLQGALERFFPEEGAEDQDGEQAE